MLCSHPPKAASLKRTILARNEARIFARFDTVISQQLSREQLGAIHLRVRGYP
jgi:hypothetical protein